MRNPRARRTRFKLSRWDNTTRRARFQDGGLIVASRANGPSSFADKNDPFGIDRQMLVRRLREGGEFFGYLRERKQIVRSRQEQMQLQA